MNAVATEWPLSGHLHLRHQADHAKQVRNVRGITVFRSRLLDSEAWNHRGRWGGQADPRRVFGMARSGMQLCERLNLLSQATIVGV